MPGRPFSTRTRLTGALLTTGSLVLSVRLIWEMTVLTWREGLQAVGFTLFHSMPSLALLGLLSLVGAGVWCLFVMVQWGRKTRVMSRIDHILLVTSLLTIMSFSVPYSTWRWLTERVLGPTPIPAAVQGVQSDASSWRSTGAVHPIGRNDSCLGL